MIKLCGITKTYGTGDNAVHALRGIDLSIEDGALTVIVGKSGSGKTTLLNMIGGLDRPSTGEVYYDDVDITRLSDHELSAYRNQNTGFVFQAFYLEPSYTVLANVAMPLLIRGMPKAQRENEARRVIERLGLKEKVEARTSDLSGGEKQRVAIARALMTGARLILADEPTGNLDSENGEAVMKILKTISTEGRIVVMVTHDLDDARRYGDRIIEIKDGLVSGSAS